MQKFRSEWLPSKEGIKDGERQKQIYNLGPSALFTGVNNYFLAELSQLSAPGSAKRIGQPLLP